MKAIHDFTRLYQLSKTLQFELVPEPETKVRFDEWLKSIQNETLEVDNLFAKDSAIFDAYNVLKPALDKIHENFITKCLESKQAKSINFKSFFDKYKKKANLIDEEKKLRLSIGKTYQEGISLMNGLFCNTNTKEGTNFIKALTDKSILIYIEKNISHFVDDQATTEEKLKKSLSDCKHFFTCFSGYNTNRKNYYEFKEEKATAIATRIVHENLPKFCDNAIRFEKNKEEYLNVDNYIKCSSICECKDIRPIGTNIFDITFFNNCLSQSEIENYNYIISKYNILINLYNQAKQKEEKSKTKLSEFVPLYKQIGCGKSKALFVEISKDRDCELTDQERQSSKILTVEKLFKVVAEAGNKMFIDQDNSTNTVPYFIKWLKNCDDWRGVYWSKTALTIISNLYFANWHDLKDKLKMNNACASFDKNREEQIQLNDAVELSGLFDVLDKEKTAYIFKKTLFDEHNDLLDNNLKPSKNLINLICAEVEKNINFFLQNSDKMLTLEKYKGNKSFEVTEDVIIAQIKNWFDASINVIRIVRYFSVNSNKMKGFVANSEMEQMLSVLLDYERADWYNWYDSIRNYLTKRPQDDVKKNKLKLNFGSSSLLRGWSDGLEKVKLATILKKDAVTYLCILAQNPSKKKKCYSYNNTFDTSDDNNPIYKNNGDASRLILNILSFKTLSRMCKIGGELYSKVINTDKYQEAIDALIQHIKTYIMPANGMTYADKYISLKNISERKYTDVDTFKKAMDEALKDCYECKYKPIDWEIVKEKESLGELFLFRIQCKDYKKGSIGKKDLQTLYWEDVLSEKSMHQLCGEAEIFKRDPIGDLPVKHKIRSKLVNKKDVDGNTIPEIIYHELYLFANNKKENLSESAQSYLDKNKIVIKEVKHEIIKDKRFYNDYKYIFHCPIKLNYSSKKYKNPSSAYSEINAKINESIQQNANLQFVGIDRGEKHLVYVCTIDNDGKIVKCLHYDNINGTNYVQKLEEKSDERTKARKDWQVLSSIRNLKDGYISHVVHRIVDEVIKNIDNTINPHSYIVLEDLNTEMKRGRQKFEKQVYQKLETALAKKLNFVVSKDSAIGEIASVANALQLTPPIANYQDIEGKKQFGIMLYTRANYTSITDPQTGWRKTIYLKNGNDEEIKNQILEDFTDFGYDKQDYYFDYTEKNADKTWRLYSGNNGESLPRFKNKKRVKDDFNIWVPEQINVVPILESIFKKFDKSKSFKAQIERGVTLSKVSDRKETAWQSLRFVIDLIQQIRNSGNKGTKDDNFLYSPVRNNKKEHFDSRNSEYNEDLKFIKDADANGAYNIARKGLIMNAHINEWIKNGKQKMVNGKKESIDLDLFISDIEWDLWLLDRKKWKQMLPIFASRTSMGKFRNKIK